MKGPDRALLDTYLQGTENTVGRINDAAADWSDSATLLSRIATSLSGQIPKLATAFGEDSAVAKAAKAAFQKAADDMQSRSSDLQAGSTQLMAVHKQIVAAQKVQQQLTPPDDPGTAPKVTDSNDKGQKKAYNNWKSKSDAASKAYSDNETAARAQIDKLDTAFGDATLTMQEIHGQKPADPATPPASGSSGGERGTTVPPAHGSTPPLSSHIERLHPRTEEPPYTPVVHGPTIVHSAPSSTPTPDPSNGGLLQGTGTPVPSTPASVPTQVPAAPAASAGAAGLSGAGSAGALGAGAMGGLGAFGAGGAGASPALRFTPGQRIGGISAGRLNAGALGAEEEAAIGRTGTTSGSAGGASRTGGVGAGGGRGGRSGSSARAGAGRGGVGAGRGRGRDRKRGEQDEDLWDDGSDWVDDEGSGPAVMR